MRGSAGRWDTDSGVPCLLKHPPVSDRPSGISPAGLEQTQDKRRASAGLVVIGSVAFPVWWRNATAKLSATCCMWRVWRVWNLWMVLTTLHVQLQPAGRWKRKRRQPLASWPLASWPNDGLDHDNVDEDGVSASFFEFERRHSD